MLNQFLRAKLAARLRLHSVMSPGPGVKDKTIDEAFQEQCILWERGASDDVDWDFVNFYMHRNI